MQLIINLFPFHNPVLILKLKERTCHFQNFRTNFAKQWRISGSFNEVLTASNAKNKFKEPL